jgi:UDP-3-O-[3-hydroxymyristoyl] glucosamine N-acyltransferase
LSARMGPRHTDAGISLRDLAAHSGADLVGDGDVLIRSVATLNAASDGAIAFLANPKYRAQLAATRASAVIVSPRDADTTALPKLVSANPYATYARVATLFHPAPPVVPGTHATAVVASSARVAASASLAPYVVIGERTVVGERAQVHAGVVIGDDCAIGDDVTIHPRVVVYARTRIGPRTIVHAGAVLGADGFGMAEQDRRWIKVPQVGGVVLGADVEIGANTTIDRGALDDTVLEDDVKLDNQIQVGHNCRIGAHTAIAGCVGIAGSTHIGKNCKIGGAAMIDGHLEIADGTIISGATGVFDSITEAGTYTATFPAMPHQEWRHVAAIVRRLRMLSDSVRQLERKGGGHGGEHG